jgi:tRNA(fMet)-specific endonuclease VapC
MLDTNICSYIIRGHLSKENLIGKNIGISSIVASELLYGAKKKGSKKLIKIVDLFLNSFEVYDFNKQAAEEYSKIRVNLEKQGLIIGAYDLQIAAHAKSLDAVLVTNNIKEFNRINGLKLENWTESHS